jgi:hypothetical protein
MAASALAAPTVRLRAALTPETPRHSTTIRLSVRIAPAGELVPPPLIEGELRYPAGLDIQLSGLGIEACKVIALELFGPEGCPRDSVVGYGSAIASLPIKREVFSEAARIAVVRTDEQEGRQALLLYVYGETGLSAKLVLPAELLPAAKPYGGLLDIHVPLVPTFPEGPDVSVSELRLVLGPSNLVYYERVHNRVVRYKPAGIPLPGHCPRKGFPFAVELSFLDASHVSARATVPCPGKAGSGGRRAA